MRKSAALAGAAMLALMVSAGAYADDPPPAELKDEAGKVLTADAKHGEVVFKQCGVCHSAKEGDNRIGPSLYGVIGRTAGTVPKFNYSPANKNSGIVWTQDKIFAYLQKPQAMVPGTKMTFPGLPKAQDRADVIAYLVANAK